MPLYFQTGTSCIFWYVDVIHEVLVCACVRVHFHLNSYLYVCVLYNTLVFRLCTGFVVLYHFSSCRFCGDNTARHKEEMVFCRDCFQLVC